MYNTVETGDALNKVIQSISEDSGSQQWWRVESD